MAVYKVTESLPRDERFRLIDQMCKASYSVPMNITEGNEKFSIKHRLHFFEIAAASLEELQYQMLLSKDLGYISMDKFQSMDIQIRKVSFLLNKLRFSLKSRS